MMDDYQLRIELERKHVFVTQLREEDDIQEDQDIKHIPIVKEKAGRLLETGINTLQTTLLLKKELEVDKIHAELEEKKKEFAERIENCKLKETQLKKKQSEIRDRIEKFDRFIKENEAKRKRAIQKYQQESRLKEQKSKELDSLQLELEALMLRHQRLKVKLTKYSRFEKYLTGVVDQLPEDYLEATDNILTALMMRFQTLSSANETLLAKLAGSSDEVEDGHQTLQDLRMTHTQQLLVYNSQLATLQKSLESMIQENVKHEQMYSHNSTLNREQVSRKDL